MFDVVVVGAGLSGLQAAYSAQKAGLSVVVVEARDRVGGKVWSVPLASKRGCADLGAAWVNDTLQKRVWSYVEQFGLQVVKQRLDGKAVMETERGERVVYPFGITPEVGILCSRVFLDTLLTRPNSSLLRRRRTWNSSATTSKLLHCVRKVPAPKTTM